MEILGYHIVLSAYGFWLPNDPRGSWSNYVGSRELYQFGAATNVDTRHSVADQSHDKRLRQSARQSLKYSPVVFNGRQALVIAQAVGSYLTRSRIRISAFAVMPDHMHLVLSAVLAPLDQLVIQLKSAITRALSAAELHPFQHISTGGQRPHCWARGYWKVFLTTVEQCRACLRYVENNPVKAGLKPQRWSFVTPDTP